MTLKEKNALIGALAILAFYVPYGFWYVQGGVHSKDQIMAIIFGCVIITVLISIGLGLGVAIVSLFNRQPNEAEDERDRRVSQKSARNGYIVLMSIMWTIPFLALICSAVLTANVALLGLVGAELVNYGSRLYYYRWSSMV